MPMMHINKLFFIGIFFILVSFLFGIPPAYAQLCSGNTTCSTTTYYPPQDTQYLLSHCYCYTCGAPVTSYQNSQCFVHNNTCGSCVANSQICSEDYSWGLDYGDACARLGQPIPAGHSYGEFCANDYWQTWAPNNPANGCSNTDVTWCGSCSSVGGGNNGSCSCGGTYPNCNACGGGGGGGGPACPLPGDAKTYTQGNNCYSSTGLGYNTNGGNYTCGPVACPGDNSGAYNHGHTCMYSQGGGGCVTGWGGGGYNPGAQEGGCNYDGATSGVGVSCPPQNQTVTIQVHDAGNNGIPNVGLTVYDNAHGNYSITTNGSGVATFASWSGDHFQAWPNANASYSFDKNQGNPVDGIVNTSWSCGTTTNWPNPTGANAPCVITATPVSFTVSGTVINNFALPIPNAKIYVFDFTNGQQTLSTTTDGNGNWNLANLVQFGDAFAVRPGGGQSYPADCPAGYLCDQNQSSPNPWSYENQRGGGSPNCGTNCNFTYTEKKISGHVYHDYNHDGIAESPYPGITVDDNAGQTTTTDGNGYYEFRCGSGNCLANASYTITAVLPGGTAAVGSDPAVNITPNPLATADFFITPLYTISGRVYTDADAGRCYNPPGVGCTDNSVNPAVAHGAGTDSLYTSSTTTATITGPGVNQSLTGSSGAFTSGQSLESGTYTVSFTTLPADYHMTYPLGSTPPQFSVTVGIPGQPNPCSTNNYNDANCDGAGNINSLGFGINNQAPFTYGWCSDVRNELSLTDFIPATPTCGTVLGNYAILNNTSCNTGTGIYVSGAVTPDFGHGGPNSNSWLVGGATAENFTPVQSGVIRTSSSYINTTIKENNLPTTNLANVCNTNSCYLPDNLPSGIYIWPSNVIFSGSHNSSNGIDTAGTYTFPTGKNYVFVIGKDASPATITFLTKIFVPNGSTATFVSSKDIVVDPSIGENSITSTAPDMEGFYSADSNFIIQSAYNSGNRCNDNGTGKDLRFNLIGSVVVNAAKTGGTFINQRDLCVGDLTCPTFTIGNGTDTGADTNLGITYLLNAPALVRHKNFFWQELAP